MKNEKWFLFDIPQLEKKLKTNAASGLSRKAARSRWSRNSGSVLLETRKTSVRMLGEIFSDFALILLLLAAVFSLFFDDVPNGIAVLALSLIHLVICFFTYYRSQRTMESIARCFRPTARVIRGGKLYYMDYSQVVMGDVILLERGDILLADVRLVTSDGLRVRMRTGLDTYADLEKYAGGAVRPNEHLAEKMVNMAHAGSVIEEGSARGIVTAIGRYTYLAAKTGGIVEESFDDTPRLLRSMRRLCSKISMISLVSVLPFCILSLVLSYWNHGEVLLSTAFLTALAITVSSMAQLAQTVCKAFFVVSLRALADSDTPTVVRSLRAFERFCQSDYLFVLDGAACSDGSLHFERAVTADGEITRYDVLSPSAKVLSRLVALYGMAEKRSLSVGVDVSEEFREPLDEFCRTCRTDRGELAIRYPKLFYFPGNGGADTVRFIEDGAQRFIEIGFDDFLDGCPTAIVHGSERTLLSEGVSGLKKIRMQAIAEGKRVLSVSLRNAQDGPRCFVGMLIVGDGTEKDLPEKILHLRRMGITPIFFESACNENSVPKLPSVLQKLPSASADMLKKENATITKTFGRYMRYDGVREEEIAFLMSYLQSKKKRVSVLSFSDYAPSVLEKADAVISCSAIRTAFSGYLDQEISSLETDGVASSASCLQTVKASADILISRPKNGKGGMSALIALRQTASRCQQNLQGFFGYLLCAQLIRLIAVALPMLFGSASLNARHILVCSFLFDIAVLFSFCRNKKTNFGKRETLDFSSSFQNYVSNRRAVWIGGIAASLSIGLLPYFMEWLGWIGPYLYKVEFCFSAILLLHIAVFCELRYGGIGEAWRKKDVLALFFGTLLFLMLCFFIKPFGLLFGVEGNTLPYTILSVIPALVFIGVRHFLQARQKKRNQ